MARLINYFDYFVTTVRVNKSTKRHTRGRTAEIEEPYRVSDSHVLRVFGERALVVGKLKHTNWSETTALTQAIELVRRPDLDDEVISWQRPSS